MERDRSQRREVVLPLASGGLVVGAASLAAAIAAADPRFSAPLTLAGGAFALLSGASVIAAWRRERRDAAFQSLAERRRRQTLQDDVSRLEGEGADRDAERTELQAERARLLAAVGRLRAEADRLLADRDRRERERDGVAAEAHQLREEMKRVGAALTEARQGKAAVERARLMEQNWIRELRTRVHELQRDRGVLGDPKDVPVMVLRMAMALLDARKGLLMSREDADGDGELDVAAWEGFQTDPHDSLLAQRFAREVIAHDQIVREDDAERLGNGERTGADEEIENLLAIPIYILDNFTGVVVCANRPGGFADFDEETLVTLGGHAGAAIQNARLQSELRGSYLSTVRVLAEALEAKDGSLRGRSGQIAGYAGAVAQRLGMSEKEQEEIVFAALLRDIGKIGIAERILLKPGPLTPEEFGVIRLHPRIGHRIVQQVPVLESIALAILHHHERFDGSGYPSGLRGEEIPRDARILAVVDAFAAMTVHRPYRAPLTLDEARAELQRHAGTQFDPEIVRLFLDQLRQEPPEATELTGVGAALEDPELSARRQLGEPLLGLGSSFALTDNLTLLYSHRHFFETLGAEAERARVQGSPFSLILVELEGLDQINTRNGYAAGDAALQSAARVLQRAASGCAGMAFRTGGRRMALLAPHLDEPGARTLADRIQLELPREVERECSLSGNGTSGGVATGGVATGGNGLGAEELTTVGTAAASETGSVADGLDGLRSAADGVGSGAGAVGTTPSAEPTMPNLSARVSASTWRLGDDDESVLTRARELLSRIPA